mgnify:CR=1 FL=1
MQALLKMVKGQRSGNIAITLSHVIGIVGHRTNKAAYEALGKIEAAARKHRTAVEKRAIEQGILIKTVSSVSPIPATERKNFKREWVA